MILVDMPITIVSQRGIKQFSHMVSDTSLDELHEMAGKLGVKRCWFHKGHYDLKPEQMARAVVEFGVHLVPRRDLVERMVGRA